MTTRYTGEFLLDGQSRLFNLEASSLEDAENRLMSLYPGRSIAVVDGRAVEAV